MLDSKRLAACLTAMLTTLAAGPAIADDGNSPPLDRARGARLYSENCGRCHNARGPVEYSDAHWPIVITHMRVIAGLPGEQARAIEAFLRASNNPPRPKIAAAKREPATVSGEELLEQYGCRGCHRIGGAGGTIGPDLAGLFDRRSMEWIGVQIQNPVQHNRKTLMPVYGLTDAETAAIVEALRTDR